MRTFLEMSNEYYDKNVHMVYIISSLSQTRTYIGYTNDIVRRLRQHNGEILGGAKHTRKNRPWKLVCYIKGFKSHKEALSFEWYLSHRPPRYRCKMQISLKTRFDDLQRIIDMWKVKYNRTLWLRYCKYEYMLDNITCHFEYIKK